MQPAPADAVVILASTGVIVRRGLETLHAASIAMTGYPLVVPAGVIDIDALVHGSNPPSPAGRRVHSTDTSGHPPW